MLGCERMSSRDSSRDRDRTAVPSAEAETIVEARDGEDDDGQPLPEGEDGSLSPGTRLGRYVVLEEIGQGGMGMVFAAYDPELNRKVALKLMRPNQRERKRKKNRLLKEAQALAKLAHPNVITVYDVGTLDDRVFVAMELVEGDTLKGWLKKKKRKWDEILKVFVQAGRGLAAAHTAGLIHRDFKPDNVLIGGDGRVRVMDFGLARPAPGNNTGSLDPEELAEDLEARENAESPTDVIEPMLTQTGSIMGTPAYMAPEQHMGTATDARSDQFSFCTSLYHGLYGVRPFDGDDAAVLMRQKHEFELSSSPSSMSVPGWVRRAMLRGLAPKADERWPSMDELLDELENDPRVARRKWMTAIGGVSVMVGSVLGVQYYRSQRPNKCAGFDQEFAEVWNDGRKAAAKEGLSGGLAAGADPEWVATAWDKIEGAVDGYGSEWVDMATEACEATHVRGEQSPRLLGLRQDCLGERLAEVDAFADIMSEADETITARSLQAALALSPLSRCADSEALAAAVDPPEDEQTKEAVTDMRRQLARAKVLHGVGHHTKAKEIASEMLATARQLEYPPAVAEAWFRLGTVEGADADARQSEEDLQESAWLAASVKHDTIAASAATELVHVVGLRLDKHQDGLAWARHAEAAVKRIGLGGMDEAVLRHNVGEIHRADGAWSKATESFDTALEIYEKLPRTELAIADVLRNLGDVRIGEKRFDEAQAYFQRARELSEEAAGANHALVAKAVAGLGRVEAARGRFADARTLYTQALGVVKDAVGTRAVQLAPIHQDVARSLVAEQGWPDAIKHHEQALELLEDALGEHPRVARALHELGRTRLASGDRPGARVDYERALRIWEKSRGKDHPDLAFGLTQIALLDLEEEQPKQAIERLERALKVRGRKGLKPVLLADTQFALARALWMSGEDHARARELASKAHEAYAEAGPEAADSLAHVNRWLAENSEDRDKADKADKADDGEPPKADKPAKPGKGSKPGKGKGKGKTPAKGE